MSQIELFNHSKRIIIIKIINNNNKSLKLYSCMQVIRIRQEYMIDRITNVK